MHNVVVCLVSIESTPIHRNRFIVIIMEWNFWRLIYQILRENNERIYDGYLYPVNKSLQPSHLPAIGSAIACKSGNFWSFCVKIRQQLNSLSTCQVSLSQCHGKYAKVVSLSPRLPLRTLANVSHFSNCLRVFAHPRCLLNRHDGFDSPSNWLRSNAFHPTSRSTWPRNHATAVPSSRNSPSTNTDSLRSAHGSGADLRTLQLRASIDSGGQWLLILGLNSISMYRAMEGNAYCHCLFQCNDSSERTWMDVSTERQFYAKNWYSFFWIVSHSKLKCQPDFWIVTIEQI